MQAGINFRSTSAFVTDGASETYCLAADTYPTVRGGFTFGWETTVSGTRSAANRSAAIDRRLAGINFFATDGEGEFRLDLDATGDYDVRGAFGDNSSGQSPAFILKDGTTAFATQALTATTAGHFLDATGADYAAANWPASNTAVSRTFSTTIFRCRIGPGDATGGQPVITHLAVASAGAGGALTGSSAATSGATGTLSGNGALSGTSAATSGATGTIANGSAASGEVSGISMATSGATATLTAIGALIGSSAIVSNATGTLIDAIGHLSGAVSATSGATGTLRDGNPNNIWQAVSAASGTWTPTSNASGTWTPV